MTTKQLYMTDSYQKTATATVIKVVTDPEPAIVLDQTIFYAQGGGQSADQGVIKGKNGQFSVTHVSYNGGEILHKGKLDGEIAEGEEVSLEIDWDLRYQNMQKHTAGHIVDQAVKNILPEANSLDGNHGIGKKMYIEFTTSVSNDKLTEIEQEANRIISEKLDIKTEMVSHQDLIDRNIKLPFDLPQNKDLRIVQIGEYPAMPDGGTQLKNTSECWPIKITDVVEKEGKWRVMYEVNSPLHIDVKKMVIPEPANTNHQSITTQQLESQIASVKSQLTSDSSLSTEELRVKYLGKKGLFNDLAKSIKDAEDKKIAGQLLNELKQYIEEELNNIQLTTDNSTTWKDLTIPGIKPTVGHKHPISQAIEEITQIFERVGFTRARYPEVDWDWYVFESLNMPPDHPARDEWETFFIDAPDTSDINVEYDMNNPRQRHPDLIGGKLVLTTHTSNGQVREMERLNSQPPIRMVNIGRCYRRQQDATHTQMFHQFEGLVVDKGINIQHLKGTLDYFAEQFYGPGTKSRIRPFHFQFTEPSFEVDFSCHICEGTGQKDGAKCKFCKSGWHEVGGAGMVHPNVLKAGGIDPEVYTGFAFGWGVERTYTLKEGLNIDDIRLLYSGDLKFLRQF